MDFKEWYGMRTKGMTAGTSLEIVMLKNSAEQGWVACKEEILKILEEYNNDSNYKYIKEKIEKEI